MDPEGADAEVSEGLDLGLAAAGVSAEELASCVSVLERLQAAEAAGALAPDAPCLRGLRKALAQRLVRQQEAWHLPQKDALDRQQRQRLEKQRQRERRQRQQEADRRWQNNAQLRASRLAKLEALEALEAQAETGHMAEPGGDVEDVEAEAAPKLRIPDGPADDTPCDARENYSRQQACYICKVRFTERHHFYSHLCPACATLNYEKRHRVADFEGRVCLVTGARVKIGFQVALKFLRMGARVIITTRFPQDARKRYLAEADSERWLDRLRIFGADFRFLGGVEAMCQELCRREKFLDVIVNNACQTVRRPAAYYAHLLQDETRALALDGSDGPHPAIIPMAGAAVPALTQLAVLGEDRMRAEDVSLTMPAGEQDVHGQQLDLRSTNSWLLKLGEVETPEAVEVFCINALAPFIINSSLRPLLESSPMPDRYIVNVSAMEGKFYRYKQPTHPHTNMAKAGTATVSWFSLAFQLCTGSTCFSWRVGNHWKNTRFLR